MTHAANKVRWCLKKAEQELRQGTKHRGLVRQEPDTSLARAHIEKAEHNLRAALHLQAGGFTDWCASTLFYAIYHCFLAVLAKHGYASRNQECTFALVQSLIEDNQLAIAKEDLEQVSRLDAEGKHESPTVVSLREEYQYTTKLSLGADALQGLFSLSKRILDRTKAHLAGG